MGTMFGHSLIIAVSCSFNCVLVQSGDFNVEHRIMDQVAGKFSSAYIRVVHIACDISFGNRQLEQFMCDRPDTRKVVEREPVLRQMLIWCFAGEFTHNRVYWDSREPTGGSPAEHLPSLAGYPALIEVTNSCDTSAIDKCTMLLFELCNVESDKEYQRLLGSTIGHRKSRDDFAMSCVRLEFVAGKRTQRFFKEHPIEGATFKNSPYYMSLLLELDSFSDYLQFLDGLPAKEYDPRRYYRKAYDRLLSSFR
jgi:hypothetical protein